MQRSKRNLAMAAGAAMIASTALSGAAMVGSADAAAVQHTMKFVAISDKEHRAGNNGFLATEIDRNHGRFLGYDTISGLFSRQTGNVKIYVAVARHGGLLFGRLHNATPEGDSFVGQVTGGSGRFAGARGTVTARNAPHDDGRTYVIVHYTLPAN